MSYDSIMHLNDVEVFDNQQRQLPATVCDVWIIIGGYSDIRSCGLYKVVGIIPYVSPARLRTAEILDDAFSV